MNWLNDAIDLNEILCDCVHPSTLKDMTLRCPDGEGIYPS